MKKTRSNAIATAEIVRVDCTEDVERICWANAQRRARNEAYLARAMEKAEAKREAEKLRKTVKAASAAVAAALGMLGVTVAVGCGCSWMVIPFIGCGLMTAILGGW